MAERELVVDRLDRDVHERELVGAARLRPDALRRDRVACARARRGRTPSRGDAAPRRSRPRRSARGCRAGTSSRHEIMPPGSLNDRVDAVAGRERVLHSTYADEVGRRSRSRFSSSASAAPAPRPSAAAAPAPAAARSFARASICAGACRRASPSFSRDLRRRLAGLLRVREQAVVHRLGRRASTFRSSVAEPPVERLAQCRRGVRVDARRLGTASSRRASTPRAPDPAAEPGRRSRTRATRMRATTITSRETLEVPSDGAARAADHVSSAKNQPRQVRRPHRS